MMAHAPFVAVSGPEGPEIGPKGPLRSAPHRRAPLRVASPGNASLRGASLRNASPHNTEIIGLHMTIRTCTAQITGISTYSPSGFVTDERPKGVTYDEWEEKIWQKKAHYDREGFVVVPLMGFKKAIASAARLTPRKMTGRKTFNDAFKTSILLTEPLRLPLTAMDLRSEAFLCSSTGDSRGVGGRVMRRFPMIDDWGGKLTFYVTMPEIPERIFETYLAEAGQFIGVGRFRPENGGVNGRFRVNAVRWDNLEGQS